MISKTTVKNNTTEIPKELLDKIPNIKTIKWNIKNNDKVELEFEMNEECEALAKELDEISAEMESGKKTKWDVDSFVKKYNL